MSHGLCPRSRPSAPCAAHLWLAPLDSETISVFATAFTLSAKKRGCRVSTERFLAALPDYRKEQMVRLCKDAQNECRFIVKSEDLPAPMLPPDWQEHICFSTCVETTLLKCKPGTDLTTFLKLLCSTAVRLHCIVDRNLPVDAYLTDEGPAARQPPALAALATPDPHRWQSHPVTTLVAGDDVLVGDVLEMVLSKARSVELLRTCKAVSSSWRHAARHTLCNLRWLRANRISLHDLLKRGSPSPRLVLALTNEWPACMHERDGEGLLPLQCELRRRIEVAASLPNVLLRPPPPRPSSPCRPFCMCSHPPSLGSTLALRKRADAAAYRMNAELVTALRQATAALLPASAAWANSAEARSIKSHLRPVRTRIAHAPIAA